MRGDELSHQRLVFFGLPGRFSRRVTFFPFQRIFMQDNESRLHHLFAQVHSGQASSYGPLLQEIAGLVRRYLRRKLTQQDADVEDLVQEVLLAIHLKRHTYDLNMPATAWVYAIARYKLIDFWRRQGRSREVGSDDDDVFEVEGPSSIQDFETQRDLGQALAQLVPKQREVIELVKLKGLSVQEAAQSLGMSESAVKVTTHRGIQAMAKWFGKRA
jgi:RNA polymerase sigma-70 factor, ECF subfamily